MKNVLAYLQRLKIEDLERDSNIHKLFGDASNRQFYRIKLEGEDSYVLMINPEPFEINNFPYLIQYNLYSSLGLPVANVFYIDENKGWILLEDLGDIALQSYIDNCSKDEIKELYKEAIGFIIKLQSIDYEMIKQHSKALQFAFDTQKLFDELNFFYQHFFIGMLNLKILPLKEKILKEGFYYIANYLACRPRVLCHRDFHSRNIMVKNSKLYLIDFQDGRLGPRSYDLVSLLRDSYVDIGNDLRNELLEYFELNKGEIEKKELIYMSLQRNLKAIGTFAYQYCFKLRDLYIGFIPRTISYIIENLFLVNDIEEFKLALLNYMNEARERLNVIIENRRL